MSKSFRSLAMVITSMLVLLGAVMVVLAAPTGPVVPTGVGGPTVIAVTAPDSQRPQLAYANAITHAVWVDGSWIAHSRNTGLGWTAPISVAIGDDPSLTLDSAGVPQLAFTALISGTLNVYHARYSANAWGAPLQVSEGLANTSAPDIAAAPDTSLTIVWSEGVSKQLHLARSTNGGQTWPDVTPIFAANGSAPKVAIGSDNVTHVAWQDDTAAPFRIKHTQRVTGTWTLIDVLSDETASSFAPDVSASGNEAHLVWQQSSAILYTHGVNLNFTAPLTLSTGTASAPKITAVTATSLAAAWDAGVSISLRVNDSGTWGAALNFGTNASGAGQPTLSAGPNGVVYGAFTWGATGSRDIAFNAYTPDVLPNAPTTPILIAPTDGSFTATPAINLMWQMGAGGTSAGYNIDVNGSIITTTSPVSPVVLSPGTYTWTVRAFNATGYSTWATAWSFKVLQPRLFLPLIMR